MTELDKALLQRLSRLQAPDCPSVAALGDFLDEKGGAEERQTVELHLRGCPACVNRLIELRELAYLEQAGEDPPAALVNRLKRLAPAQEPTTAATPSVREWISDSLSSVRRWVWQWTSPRPLGGVIAVSAVAVFLFVVGPTLWRQQNGDAVLTDEARRMLDVVFLPSTDQGALLKQLAASLEKVPKNLLLEETRGASNVEVYKKAAPATVLVVTESGVGSGVVISQEGGVLTNWHVVQNETQVAVVFKPQRGIEVRKDLAFAARVIAVNQETDLALLKILTPPQNLTVLLLGDLADIEVGQDVHAIGHPEGEVWTYTTGIISQVRPRYKWTGADKLSHQSTVIQTQTALNPGNSGGPLLNDRVEVIGINSFRGEGEGLNYAVAIDTVKSFLQQARSASAPSRSSSRPTSYKTEAYGSNIVGVYLNTRVPPPGMWLVYKDGGRQMAYAAMGSKIPTTIDTVIQEADPREKSLLYYFDADCDGMIDLIGFDSDGDNTVDRYDLPREPFPLAGLARELAQAIQKGAIPYPEVRMCQE